MLPWLPAYRAMLPALQAQEAMLIATAMAVGSGSMKKANSRRIMSDWNKAAQAGQKKVKPKTREEHHSFLQRLGISAVSTS